MIAARSFASNLVACRRLHAMMSTVPQSRARLPDTDADASGGQRAAVAEEEEPQEISESSLPARCCRRPRATSCTRPSREVLAARWPVNWREVEARRPRCGQVPLPHSMSCWVQFDYWRDGPSAKWWEMSVDQYRWAVCARFPLEELPGDAHELLVAFLDPIKEEDDMSDDSRDHPVAPWERRCDECGDGLDTCDYCLEDRACWLCDHCSNQCVSLCCEICFHNPALPWRGRPFSGFYILVACISIQVYIQVP